MIRIKVNCDCGKLLAEYFLYDKVVGLDAFDRRWIINLGIECSNCNKASLLLVNKELCWSSKNCIIHVERQSEECSQNQQSVETVKEPRYIEL